MREINEILVYYIFKSLSPGCLPLLFSWVGLHYNVHQTVFPTNGLQQRGPAFPLCFWSTFSKQITCGTLREREKAATS